MPHFGFCSHRKADAQTNKDYIVANDQKQARKG
jgi:hypothetical protein